MLSRGKTQHTEQLFEYKTMTTAQLTEQARLEGVWLLVPFLLCEIYVEFSGIGSPTGWGNHGFRWLYLRECEGPTVGNTSAYHHSSLFRVGSEDQV